MIARIFDPLAVVAFVLPTVGTAMLATVIAMIAVGPIRVLNITNSQFLLAPMNNLSLAQFVMIVASILLQLAGMLIGFDGAFRVYLCRTLGLPVSLGQCLTGWARRPGRSISAFVLIVIVFAIGTLFPLVLMSQGIDPIAALVVAFMLFAVSLAIAPTLMAWQYRIPSPSAGVSPVLDPADPSMGALLNWSRPGFGQRFLLLLLLFGVNVACTTVRAEAAVEPAIVLGLPILQLLLTVGISLGLIYLTVAPTLYVMVHRPENETHGLRHATVSPGADRKADDRTVFGSAPKPVMRLVLVVGAATLFSVFGLTNAVVVAKNPAGLPVVASEVTTYLVTDNVTVVHRSTPRGALPTGEETDMRWIQQREYSPIQFQLCQTDECTEPAETEQRGLFAAASVPGGMLTVQWRIEDNSDGSELKVLFNSDEQLRLLADEVTRAAATREDGEDDSPLYADISGTPRLLETAPPGLTETRNLGSDARISDFIGVTIAVGATYPVIASTRPLFDAEGITGTELAIIRCGDVQCATSTAQYVTLDDAWREYLGWSDLDVVAQSDGSVTVALGDEGRMMIVSAQSASDAAVVDLNMTEHSRIGQGNGWDLPFVGIISSELGDTGNPRLLWYDRDAGDLLIESCEQRDCSSQTATRHSLGQKEYGSTIAERSWVLDAQGRIMFVGLNADGNEILLNACTDSECTSVVQQPMGLTRDASTTLDLTRTGDGRPVLELESFLPWSQSFTPELAPQRITCVLPRCGA